MKHIIGILCLVVAGCATTKLPPPLTYEQAKKDVEAKGALISPKIEEREGYKDGQSQALLKDNVAPFPGLLLDKDRTAKVLAIIAERDRRYKELEAERKKNEIKTMVYESTIENLRARAAQQSTWWEENKGLIGFGIGTAVGMAIVVGVMYALTGGKSINTSSTTSQIKSKPYFKQLEPIRW